MFRLLAVQIALHHFDVEPEPARDLLVVPPEAAQPGDLFASNLSLTVACTRHA
jgi:hypothetical protein